MGEELQQGLRVNQELHQLGHPGDSWRRVISMNQMTQGLSSLKKSPSGSKKASMWDEQWADHLKTPQIATISGALWTVRHSSRWTVGSSVLAVLACSQMKHRWGTSLSVRETLSRLNSWWSSETVLRKDPIQQLDRNQVPHPNIPDWNAT